MDNKIEFHLATKLDEEKLVEAIRNNMLKNNTHKKPFDFEYWNWKYKQLPSKESYAFIALENDNIIAYCHLSIFYGANKNGLKLKYGVMQDGATTDLMQKKGVFKELSNFMNAFIDSQNIDIIYGFPNQKSIHTFTKYNGFKELTTLKTYVLPVKTELILKSKIQLFGIEKILGNIIDCGINVFTRKSKEKFIIKFHSTINQEIEFLFSEYQNKFDYGITKDESFLKWRFLKNENYYIISNQQEKSTKIEAVVVFKIDIISNIKCLILVDFAFNNSLAVLNLIQSLRSEPLKYFNQTFGFILIASNSEINKNLHKIGFIKIPRIIQFRVLRVIIRSSDKIPDKVNNPSNWNLQLSNWDIF